MRKLALLFILTAISTHAQSYTTLFPGTENPISEGGKWIGGQSAGGNLWGNVQTNGTMAFGVTEPTQFGDPTAILTQPFGPNQTVSGTVKINVTPVGTCCHEIELRLRNTIAANSIKGYEVYCSVMPAPNQYCHIARWNGPSGSYCNIDGSSVVLNLVNGDVFSATITGTNPVIITGFRNGAQIIQATDTGQNCSPGGAAGPWASGSPGIGFYDSQDVNWSNFGFSRFSASASSFTAATCNQNDVNAVINGPIHTAVNGDTILLPAGNCTWTTGVTIPAGIGITIQGSGTPSNDPNKFGADPSCSATALTLNVNASAVWIATPGVAASTLRLSCFAENLVTGTNARGYNFQGTCNSGGCPSVRIDNLTFNNWQTSPKQAGISYGIGAIGDMFGVLDHNTLAGGTVLTATYNQLSEISHALFKGVGQWGDNSWAQPENFGSTQFLFEENNIFSNGGCCENEAQAGNGTFARGGSRIVARFNQFTQYSNFNFSMGWHGTESSGRPRGGRAFEFYGNTVNYPVVCNPVNSGNCPPIVAVRSGTGLVWGNTVNAVSKNFSGVGLNFLRTVAAINWPACDGTAPEDGNDPSANASTPLFAGHLATVVGTGYTTASALGTTKRVSVPGPAIGLTINIVASSTLPPSVGNVASMTVANGGTGYTNGGLVTINGGGNNAGALITSVGAGGVVTGITPWFWNTVIIAGASPGFGNLVPAGAPYSVHDITQSLAKGFPSPTGVGAEIDSNTANTINLPFNSSFFVYPLPGDSIQVTRAFWCMDQSTRGAGSPILNSAQSSPSIPPFPASNEVLSPTYVWMLSFPNQNPGLANNVGSDTKRVIRNRDFYTESTGQTAQTTSSSPFDGTTTIGAGHGTKALRPATCTTGVMYWATNEGNWNQSGNGFGQGNLYICTATNTWTLSYTPACYPHILVTGGVSACGAGVPGISLSPSSVAFGSVLVGSTSPSSPVTVSNTGSALLNINSITIAGTNPTDFAQTNNCGTGVSIGGSCTITVTCTPLSAASFSALVSVSDNAAGSPHTAGLTCTGTTSAPAISFAPTSVTFAAQTVGTSSSPTAVTVTNTGSGNLVISNVAIAGTNPTSFSQTNNCTTVAPAGTCTINVTFRPQVAGALSATVSVTDNAPASPQTVPLSGTGSGVAGIGFNPTNLAFGNQTVSATSSAMSVTVSNPGGAPLTLSSITLTGTNAADFAISANTCAGTLAVNATCLVSTTFTPGSTGARTANLTFTDNAPASPQNVALTGTGTQAGTGFSPVSLAFGAQTLNTTSAALTTTLTNTGSATLNISSIAIGGTNANNFAISTKTCGATLAASSTCTVSVTFTPFVAAALSANLFFTDDAPASPQAVPLTGTGQAPPTNSIAVSPSTLTFPSTVVGQAAAMQIITATANPLNSAPVTFSSVVISGGNAADFSIVNACTTIAPAGSCTATVTFTPTATGARASSVLFTDSATGSPQSVTISGTGTQSNISITPALINFGNQPVGTTSAATAVMVTNTGTATLNITSINIGGTNQSYFAKTGSCGFTLGAGMTCPMAITFTPQTAIAASAVLVFTDDAPGSPQTIPLTGTGTTSALSFNPASVTFPSTAVSSASAPMIVTVSNTGNGAVTISSISISGTNASNFLQTNNCGASLAGNASCTVTLLFTPSANGSRTANLVFTDSAPASPQSVSLQGTGFTPAPAVTLSMASITFGNQTTGTSSNPQVSILTNTGTSTLTISSTSITGTNAGDFGSSTTCSGTLAVNASCTYSFVFTPTAAGSRTATFNLTTNAASSPDHISLTGTGVSSPNGAPAPQVFGE